MRYCSPLFTRPLLQPQTKRSPVTMTQQLSPQQICSVLEQTLSPVEDVRRNAERQLAEAQKFPDHPLTALSIVAGSFPVNPAVRQAAAIHFKNIIKNGWDEHSEDGTQGIVISTEARNTIKSHLVELMCTVPPDIRAQVSESISLIAKVDWPTRWDNLLPELVHRFNSSDQAVVNGVLLTANSILKRFRYAQRSDDLYSDIAYALKHIQAPLLTLFMTTGNAVDNYPNNAAQLRPRFESLRLMCRIFFSLNYQDLPEYFEDHMQEWMDGFAKYLQYENPVLTDADEETEPSPIDTLQAAIVENLNLYADKDEEPFLPFLPNFTRLVWNLLLRTTIYPKHDSLATKSIRFLSSLVKKLMHKSLFQDDATLRDIISRIVIPNLMIRETDEERFEDDPQEYIVRDIEGEDSESRTRCSQELLRAMCRQFEPETTKICSEHINTMLAEYATDPVNKWTAKDAAIHLMLGISIRAESTAQGVSQINDTVNVMEFFSTQLVPELQDTNHAARPMVKASAIKFVSTFRNQFTTEDLTALMPLLISHLASPSVVVHTYAAFAIEKFLTVKVDVPGGPAKLKFGAAQLKPFLEPLFTSLFLIVDNVQLNENQYVMKCIMRTLSVANEDVIPVTPIVLEKLTAVLGRVAKNPRNPQFNHYMFESIAVLVRSVCSKQPEATSSFEGLLFPPFQMVLQMDVSEFTPYVFQVLAQLLEYRPRGSGLGEAYTMLFPPLLSPALWERKGNVPALVRLLKAYLGKAEPELASGHLMHMLGIFQKLLSVKATEVSACDLLCSLIVNVPLEVLQPTFKTLFQVMLQRQQYGKTPRFTRLATNFFAVFVGKFGSQLFFDELDSIQQGLGSMLITQIWVPRLQSDMPVRMEAKTQIVGLTRLLCDTPALLSDANGRQVWSYMVAMVVSMLTSAGTSFIDASATADDAPVEVEISYDSAYSNLHFAKKPIDDPFSEIADPGLLFLQSLQKLSSSHPGCVQPMIQQGLQSDPKLSAGLESMLTKAGIRLV